MLNVEGDFGGECYERMDMIPKLTVGIWVNRELIIHT